MQKLIKFLEQQGFSKEAKNLEEDNTVLEIRHKIVYIDTIKFILNILTFDSKISSKLTCLILEDAFIQSDRVKLIAEFLQQNSKLISLDLSSNGYLFPRAIEPIGKALEFNDTLKYLSLYHSKVGVIGVKG